MSNPTTDTSAPIVTIDGAPAPAAFAAHVQRSHDRLKWANGCRACSSVLYVDHGPTCPLGLGPVVST